MINQEIVVLFAISSKENQDGYFPVQKYLL